MQIDIQTDGSLQSRRICANITQQTRSDLVEISASEPLSAPEDAFLSLSLYPAMACGEDLVLPASCSSRLREQLESIQEVTASWWPERLKRIAIKTSETLVRPRPGVPRQGVFFSGGVDSFYSLMTNKDQISDLILIHGFDYAFDDEPLRSAVSEMARRVATELGKNLIEVQTNARQVFNPQINWPILHGAVLAAVGQSLSGSLQRILIPSSHCRKHILPPWGTHPDLDPLWSTEAVEFINDGTSTPRLTKVKTISQYPLALRHLRVCWNKGRQAGKNCCCCEKCLRTMTELHIAGALDRCDTFSHGIDPKRLSWVHVRPGNHAFLDEILDNLGATGPDKPLRQALERAYRRPDWVHELRWHAGNIWRFIKTGKRGRT